LGGGRWTRGGATGEARGGRLRAHVSGKEGKGRRINKEDRWGRGGGGEGYASHTRTRHVTKTGRGVTRRQAPLLGDRYLRAGPHNRVNEKDYGSTEKGIWGSRQGGEIIIRPGGGKIKIRRA